MSAGQSDMVNGELHGQFSSSADPDLMRCPLKLINAFEFQLEKCFKLSEDFDCPKAFSVDVGRHFGDSWVYCISSSCCLSFWHKFLTSDPAQPLWHKGTLYNAYINSLDLTRCEVSSHIDWIFDCVVPGTVWFTSWSSGRWRFGIRIRSSLLDYIPASGYIWWRPYKNCGWGHQGNRLDHGKK